jgi:alkylation response protein AidB-like acyl-CoA dehydrogenase
MQIPEAYGGAGMKFHDYVIALEEVARADASVGLTMASHNSLCTGHIYLAANDAQKQKYMPRLASGKALGAWGLTEPAPDRTPARRARARCARGTGGSSTAPRRSSPRGRWARSSSFSASTSPEKKAKGLTAFIIERGTPGFRTGKKIEKMGLHASDTTELVWRGRGRRRAAAG